MKVTTLGIELAKSLCQLHGVDERGGIARQRRVTRSTLQVTIAHLPPCVIGMEACASAHYWARETPPHLHFEVYTVRGAMNPLPLLRDSASEGAVLGHGMDLGGEHTPRRRGGSR